MNQNEVRAYGKIELRAENGKPAKLVGYAALYNVQSMPMGGFREMIAPNAFAKCLERNPDIRAMIDHEPTLVLGRTVSGTLKVTEDETGLRCEIDPPDTSYVRDLIESIKRGDINQMSFGFRCRDDSWEQDDSGAVIRTVKEADLFDVSVVAFPVYPDTTIAVRSMTEWEKRKNEQTPTESNMERDMKQRLYALEGVMPLTRV